MHVRTPRIIKFKRRYIVVLVNRTRIKVIWNKWSLNYCILNLSCPNNLVFDGPYLQCHGFIVLLLIYANYWLQQTYIVRFHHTRLKPYHIRSCITFLALPIYAGSFILQNMLFTTESIMLSLRKGKSDTKEYICDFERVLHVPRDFLDIVFAWWFQQYKTHNKIWSHYIFTDNN